MSAVLKPRAEPESQFSDLVDLLVMCAGESLVMLSAFCDASDMTDTGGPYAVAAVAFGPDGAKKAENAWARLWGETVCHMSDLHNLRGDFEGWDGNRRGAINTPPILARRCKLLAHWCGVRLLHQIDRVFAVLKVNIRFTRISDHTIVVGDKPPTVLTNSVTVDMKVHCCVLWLRSEIDATPKP